MRRWRCGGCRACCRRLRCAAHTQTRPCVQQCQQPCTHGAPHSIMHCRVCACLHSPSVLSPFPLAPSKHPAARRHSAPHTPALLLIATRLSRFARKSASPEPSPVTPAAAHVFVGTHAPRWGELAGLLNTEGDAQVGRAMLHALHATSLQATPIHTHCHHRTPAHLQARQGRPRRRLRQSRQQPPPGRWQRRRPVQPGRRCRGTRPAWRRRRAAAGPRRRPG
jgi:hypothetical protein